MNSAFRALILGAPGSGKGTIASRILRDFGLQHISSGDVLRKHIADETNLGRQVKAFMEQGQLVPDEIVTGLILDEVSKIRHESWLLDGFPRTIPQAISLSKMADLSLVINLNVPFEEIVSRLTSRWIHPGSGRIYNLDFNPPKQPGLDDVTGEKLLRRPDDESEAVQHRLQCYAETVAPLIRFYQEMGILQDFHGRETNKIYPSVHRAIKQVLYDMQEHEANCASSVRETTGSLLLHRIPPASKYDLSKFKFPSSAPGAGKGTISEKVVKHFDILHLSSGDILRDNVLRETKLGKQVKSYMQKGKLVPDPLVTAMMRKTLRRVGPQSWLLDGFPRTLKQAQDLSKMAELTLVMKIDVPRDLIVKRITSRLVHPGDLVL
ncbi:unnamed protein product [Cyprideis torosa]|uniref:GTP:AMP phosphotransferase, mitochondrial n=1 Tax=Cyprideis torosa TaxID=163714 RepID=A0A7R8WMJ5_9CRUS|nr:unnamed protein product [Cyprideis torosa]CAG0905366.1 unnamed protein product [Cyprideis torosa]